MKQFLLRLYRSLKKYRWYFEANSIRKRIQIKNLSDIKNERILVLMPHSDDEWIGCGMLLSKYPNNSLVVNMNMPGGDDSELHELRLREAEEMSQQVGYSFHTITHEFELNHIISSYQPSAIFVPFFIDWHDEHIMVIQSLMRSVNTTNYIGQIGMYQVSVPIPNAYINSGIKMSKKELHSKWEKLLAVYKSQSFLPVFRFMMNEYINGAISNVYSLEAYSVMGVDEWLDKISSRELSDSDKVFIRDNLDNLKVLHNWR